MAAFLEKRTYDSDLIVWTRCYDSLRFLPHYHRETELIYIRSGCAHIGVGSGSWLCEGGDLVICRGGDTHYSNDERDENVMDFIIFDPAETDKFCDRRYRLPSVLRAAELKRTGLDEYCERAYSTVRAELSERSEGWETLVRLELASLMTRLARCFSPAERSEASLGNAGVFERLGRLMEYLDGNYGSQIRLSDAADVMGYEPTYCSKMFKSLTGMGFSDYLRAVRVGKAIELLRSCGESNRPDIAGIALRCGFEVRNFNRVFRAATGMTPTDFAASGALPSRQTSGKFYDTSTTISYRGIVEPGGLSDRRNDTAFLLPSAVNSTF